VYFHYSGHGSQVQDLNGDEEDGLDETIVPQDGRSGGVRDIVDDELDVIFSKLRARSAVIVLDSCHSGTATRSFDIRARSVPQDTRIDLYRTGVTGTRTRGITPLPKSRFIVMGGAADNEEALDGPVEGSYHGFFTYALARSLTAAGNDASPREILAAVTRELGRIQTTFGRTSMPEPQLEGPPDAIDLPLFASRNAAGPGSAHCSRSAAKSTSCVARHGTGRRRPDHAAQWFIARGNPGLHMGHLSSRRNAVQRRTRARGGHGDAGDGEGRSSDAVRRQRHDRAGFPRSGVASGARRRARCDSLG
jgi:hypothetical protein